MSRRFGFAHTTWGCGAGCCSGAFLAKHTLEQLEKLDSVAVCREVSVVATSLSTDGRAQEAEIVNETARYALIILFASAVGLVAVLANRLTERVKVPVALLVLVGAAVAVHAVPAVRAAVRNGPIEHVITIALVFGVVRRRMTRAGQVSRRGGPSSVGGLRPVPHRRRGGGGAALVCGQLVSSRSCVGNRVSPTDPAVVFSVLGQRQMAGGGGAILEGESGANDPVGSALDGQADRRRQPRAAGLAERRGGVRPRDGGSARRSARSAGARAARGAMRRIPFPRRAVPTAYAWPALLLFGLATVAHGSGFLAVFVAGT